MIRSLLLGILIATAGGVASQQPIRTGIDATFAPHAMPKLGGGLEGFNIDLANDLARRMGRPIQIEGTEFSALIPGMNAKKYDFLIAPTTVTPERAKAMLFSEGYMETDYMFLQKKADKDIKGLEDLKGKTITVNKGSAYETWTKANADKYGFKYDVYGTNADAVRRCFRAAPTPTWQATRSSSGRRSRTRRSRRPIRTRPAWSGRCRSASTT